MAVSKCHYTIQFIHKKTKAICIAAVQKEGSVLSYIDYNIQDEEICYEAVKKSGYAIQYVNPPLINEDLCILAVTKCPNAIEYINKKTKAICIAAVKKNGLLLQFISVDEQDEEICYEAIKQDKSARRFAVYTRYDKFDVSIFNDSAYQQNNDCPICLNKYINNDKLVMTKCKHQFHIRCINIWLKDNITCPLCRYLLI